MGNDLVHNRITSLCVAWVLLLVLLAYGIGSFKEISCALCAAGIASAFLVWFFLPHLWAKFPESSVNVRHLNILRGLYLAFFFHSFFGPVGLSLIHGERFRVLSVFVVSFSGFATISQVRSLYTNSLLDRYE